MFSLPCYYSTHSYSDTEEINFQRINQKETEMMELFKFKETASVVETAAKIGIHGVGILLFPVLGLGIHAAREGMISLEADRMKMLAYDLEPFQLFVHLSWNERSLATKVLNAHMDFFKEICQSIVFQTWLIVYEKREYSFFLMQNGLIKPDIYNSLENALHEEMKKSSLDFDNLNLRIKLNFWNSKYHMTGSSSSKVRTWHYEDNFRYGEFDTIQGLLPRLVTRLGLLSEK